MGCKKCGNYGYVETNQKEYPYAFNGNQPWKICPECKGESRHIVEEGARNRAKYFHDSLAALEHAYAALCCVRDFKQDTSGAVGPEVIGQVEKAIALGRQVVKLLR